MWAAGWRLASSNSPSDFQPVILRLVSLRKRADNFSGVLLFSAPAGLPRNGREAVFRETANFPLHPLVRLMPSGDPHFQVIIAERFRPMFIAGLEGNHLKRP